MRAMRLQHVRFGLDYDHPDSDIKHLIGRQRYMQRYMQRIAQRREAADAATER